MNLLIKPALLFLLMVHTIPVACSWNNTNCSSLISDATANPGARWQAAQTDSGWQYAVDLWTNRDKSIQLTFPEFVSNVFNGPENWNCGDGYNVPCSTTIQCQDTNYPAGFLILNSFSSIHQLHGQYLNSINQAYIEILGDIGQFTNTFAPMVTPATHVTMIKQLIDGVVGVVATLTTALYCFAALRILDAAVNTFLKDTTNILVASSTNLVKDGLPEAQQAIDVQSDISTALDSYFQFLSQVELNYVQYLFSGSPDAIQDLYSYIQNGLTLWIVPGNINFNDLVQNVKKVIFSQLIPIAWQVAPYGHPFIMRTGEGCEPGVHHGSISDWMGLKAEQYSVGCVDGYTFYLVNGHPEPASEQTRLQVLAGGSSSVLYEGNQWGGLTFEDILTSAFHAFRANNNLNGFGLPPISELVNSVGTQGDQLFQTGNIPPGLVQLPVCTNMMATFWNIDIPVSLGSPFWPCLDMKR